MVDAHREVRGHSSHGEARDANRTRCNSGRGVTKSSGVRLGLGLCLGLIAGMGRVAHGVIHVIRGRGHEATMLRVMKRTRERQVVIGAHPLRRQ